MKPKGPKVLTYEDQKNKCIEFVRHFEDYDTNEIDDVYGRRKYMTQLQAIANGERNRFEVSIEDLESFFRKEDEAAMVSSFKANVKRYLSIFTQVAAALLPPKNRNLDPEDELREKYEKILEEHRKDNILSQNEGQFDPSEKIPFSCHQRFDVSMIYGTKGKVKVRTISDMRSEDIGSLVVVKAIVVRASSVKPEISVATYACDICGSENYQEVFEGSFKPLDECVSRRCRENKVSGKLTFLPGHSKFVELQELKIQETSDQLRQGAIPRSMNVILKGTNVKQAAPGDVIMIQGALLPSKKFGFRDQFNLAFQSHIEATSVMREKKKYVEMAITSEQIEKVEYVRSCTSDERLYERLAKSIAPEIYGLDYVKKALLLLMVGGVTKVTHDNVRIRGEINVGLIGDPGIAKSQLLKQIAFLAPRAVYTTGKGSSGVGLTAAVVTDPTTKEISLEAGALVLADMGICCIDEFDKMDEYDRTAIHEVMEQQTVSIAKAGITTSLNARTSILAAANPVHGRYKKSESAHKNINLPAALLSRFDLIFILLDSPDSSRDMELARHIGAVHQNRRAPTADTFDAEFIRTYIARAKDFEPTINPSLHKELINKYIEKRKEQSDLSKEGETYTTTRSLLALIRLCQAKAKLRFSNEVSADDIQDCLEILEESQRSIATENSSFKPKIDSKSAIYEIIKDRCNYSSDGAEDIDIIEKRVLARGYTTDDLQMTLKEYENLGVIMVEESRVILVSER